MPAEALEALVKGGSEEASEAVVVATGGAPNCLGVDIRGAGGVAVEAFRAPNKGGAGGRAADRGAEGAGETAVGPASAHNA